MRLRKPQVLLRQIHHWGAIVIALPIIVMMGAGVLLTLKKDVDWIQPPTLEGSSLEAPRATFEEMFAAAKSVPEAGIETWQDLAGLTSNPTRGSSNSSPIAVGKFRSTPQPRRFCRWPTGVPI